MSVRIPEEAKIFGLGLAIVFPLAYFLRKWADKNSTATASTTPPTATSGLWNPREARY